MLIEIFPLSFEQCSSLSNYNPPLVLFICFTVLFVYDLQPGLIGYLLLLDDDV